MNLGPLPRTRMIATTCVAMGVMVSPLSLPVIGNSAGGLQQAFLWVLPLFALLNYLTVSRGYPLWTPPGPADSPKQAASWLRTTVATLHFSALLPFCVGACTLILAAAGYTFNEVFVHWFPNLLFSVGFLVLIGVVLMSGHAIARSMQILAVLMVVGSLLLLAAIGFLTIDRPLFEGGTAAGLATFDARSFFMLFWLFMAAELAISHPQRNGVQSTEHYAMIAAFSATLVVFWLWALIAMASTPLATLAQSTTPHTLTAHLLAGAAGHTIMGVAVLAGSFAAVNTLVRGAGAALRAALTPVERQYRWIERLTQEKAVMLVIFILIAGMLLTGMAGKEETFTLKRSAFYIWLMAYAGMNICALVYPARSATGGKTALIAGIAALVIYVTAFGVLVATDPDVIGVIVFMGGFIGFCGLAALAGRRLAGPRAQGGIKPLNAQLLPVKSPPPSLMKQRSAK